MPVGLRVRCKQFAVCVHTMGSAWNTANLRLISAGVVCHRLVTERASVLRNKPVQNALRVKDVVGVAREFADEVFAMKLFKTYSA